MPSSSSALFSPYVRVQLKARTSSSTCRNTWLQEASGGDSTCSSSLFLLLSQGTAPLPIRAIPRVSAKADKTHRYREDSTASAIIPPRRPRPPKSFDLFAPLPYTYPGCEWCETKGAVCLQWKGSTAGKCLYCCTSNRACDVTLPAAVPAQLLTLIVFLAGKCAGQVAPAAQRPRSHGPSEPEDENRGSAPLAQ